MEQSYMQNEKYSRQISLPEIGLHGQKKISDAACIVVGAGGLGCPILLYLAAAGIGKITIIDDDIVSLSNLHRQILFSNSDIGKFKAEIAAQRLSRIHPECDLKAVTKRLDTELAYNVAKNADIIIDGTDSFLSKYILSDVTSHLDIPFLMGAVTGFSGYIAAFHKGATYRDIFPVPPHTAPTCNETGILGAMAGQIASMMALETLKIITNFKDRLIGKMQRVNNLEYHHHITDFSSFPEQEKQPLDKIAFIGQDALKDYDLIDIREENELEAIALLKDAHHMALSEFSGNMDMFSAFKKPVFICHSGRRAERLALLCALSQDVSFEKISILSGGLCGINTL